MSVQASHRPLGTVIVDTVKSYVQPDPNTSSCFNPHETRVEGAVEAVASLVGMTHLGAPLMSAAAAIGLLVEPNAAAKRIMLTSSVQTLVVLPLWFVDPPSALVAGAILALPGLARGLAKLAGVPGTVAPS